MNKKLSRLIFWKFLVSKLKPVLVLVFLFILAISFRSSLMEVKANNLGYNENFSTTTYEDTANTTAKWDTTLGRSYLLKDTWVNMGETKISAENVTNSFGSVEPRIQLDSAGNPYMIWCGNSTGNADLYFTKWTPGIGWTKMDSTLGSDNLSSNSGTSCLLGYGAFNIIRLDSGNNPFVIWKDNTSGAYNLYFTKWTPSTGWTKMDGTPGYDNVSNDSGSANESNMLIGTDGTPYIVWRNDSAGIGRIYFTKWTSGTGWTKMDGTLGRDEISNITFDSWGSQISLDSANNPYISWTSQNEIYFTKWTPGTGWTKMDGTLGYDNVSNNPTVSEFPHIVLDSVNNPYITWRDNYITIFKKWTPGTGWTKMDGTLGYDTIFGAIDTFVRTIKVNNTNSPYIVADDGFRDIRFAKWTPGTGWTKMDGTLGYDNLTNNVSADSYFPSFVFDSLYNPYIVWTTGLGVSDIYFTKWTPGTGWTKMDGTLGIEKLTNISGVVGISPGPDIEIDAANNPFVVWQNSTAGSEGDYLIRWIHYAHTSTIQSLNVSSASDFVVNATLTATQTLNGQTINYYLSNDGGTTWEATTSGLAHTFSSQGTDLRWRAVLSTANQNVTPVINSLNIIYQTKKILCSLSPNTLEAGQQVTINAAVTFVATSVWATVENQGTLLNTLTLSGSGGNYSANLIANNNYLGQNKVAVFASDGTQTYTCNLGDGSNWTEFSQEDIPWQPRYQTNVVEFNGKMWLIDTEIWNSADGSNWQKMAATVPWAARDDFKLIVYDNKIWLMGGRKPAPDSSYVSDVWNSSDGINWQQVTAAAPWQARSRFALAVFNGKIYLHSGQGSVGGVNTVLSDIWSYDNVNGWQLVSNTLPNKRVHHKMLVFNDGSGDKLYITGGITTGNVIMGDVWSSPDGINWTQKVPIGPIWTPRFLHQSLVFGNKLWVISGRTAVSPNTKNNDIWNTTDGIHWNLVVDPVDFPPTGTQPSKWQYFMPKEGHAALVFNNEIWVLGGLTGRLNLTNDIWHSSDGLSWSLVGTHYGSEFRPRVSGAIVVAQRSIDTNPRIWLMGGYAVNPNGLTNDVWYSDDGITWHCLLGPYTNAADGIQCENIGTPSWSARWGPNVVFYDNAFWLFGGCTDTSYISTGWWNCAAGSLLKDIYKSTDGINWVLQPAPPWPKRLLLSISVYNQAYGVYMKGDADGDGNITDNDVNILKTILSGGSATCYDLRHNVISCVTVLDFDGSFSIGTGDLIALNQLLDSQEKYIMGDADGDGQITESDLNILVELLSGHSATCYDLKHNPISCVTVLDFDGTKDIGGGDYDGLSNLLSSQKNYIWVLGGYQEETLPNGALNDAWSFNGTTWTHAPNAPWAARDGHSSVVFNDGSGEKLWVMGGYADPGGAYNPAFRKDDVWSFDGTTWQCVAGPNPGCAHPNAAWPSRYGFGLTTFDDKMFIVDGNWYKDVWSSLNGYDWTLATDDHPGNYRDFLSTVTFQDHVLVISGESELGDKNDVWGTDYSYLQFTVSAAGSVLLGINPPSAPSNLSCSAQSNSVIRWSFTDNASNETGFKLHDASGIVMEAYTADLAYLEESGLPTNTQAKDRQVTAFITAANQSCPIKRAAILWPISQAR